MEATTNIDDHRPWTRVALRAAMRLLVPGAALVLAIVGLPAHSHPADAAIGGLIVHGTDFSFDVSDPSVKPTTVHIQFLNDSKDYVHELFVFPSNQPRLAEMLAAKNAGQELDEGDYLEDVAGRVEDIDPGHSIAFDVMMPEGTYTLACFIRSPIAGKETIHYDIGMKATLISTSAPAPAAVPSAAPAPAQPVVVKAPNTGTGPASGETANTVIALLVLSGAIVIAGGSALRVSRKRGGA